MAVEIAWGWLRWQPHSALSRWYQRRFGSGNARARIFCSKNEAELVSIDGYYRTAEEMDANLRSRPAQCWLENRVLAIAALD